MAFLLATRSTVLLGSVLVLLSTERNTRKEKVFQPKKALALLLENHLVFYARQGLPCTPPSSCVKVVVLLEKQVFLPSFKSLSFLFISIPSKQMLKMAKKTLTERMGMGRGRRRDHVDGEDHLNELSRCNSYDFDLGMRESDTVYFRQRHLVPIEIIQVGMSRLSFLLETCSPGSVPDPLLIAALLDLVSPQ